MESANANSKAAEEAEAEAENGDSQARQVSQWDSPTVRGRYPIKTRTMATGWSAIIRAPARGFVIMAAYANESLGQTGHNPEAHLQQAKHPKGRSKITVCETNTLGMVC